MKYRVDMLLASTKQYVGYTSCKNLLDFEMAKSLAAYLKKQNSPGRLVEVPGEKVIDLW